MSTTTDTTTETTTTPITVAEDFTLYKTRYVAWQVYRGCPLDGENKAELLRLYSEAAEAVDRATTERLIAESKADKARDAAARRLADARAALAAAEAEAEAASAAMFAAQDQFRALAKDRQELQRLKADYDLTQRLANARELHRQIADYDLTHRRAAASDK